MVQFEYIKDHNGNILFFKKWFDAGILTINDVVMHSELMFLKQIAFFLDKNHASLTEYNIVINAIPKVWRNNMIRQIDDVTQSNIINIMKTVLMNVNNKRKSKLFYIMILNILLNLQLKTNGKTRTVIV